MGDDRLAILKARQRRSGALLLVAGAVALHYALRQGGGDWRAVFLGHGNWLGLVGLAGGVVATRGALRAATGLEHGDQPPRLKLLFWLVALGALVCAGVILWPGVPELI